MRGIWLAGIKKHPLFPSSSLEFGWFPASSLPNTWPGQTQVSLQAIPFHSHRLHRQGPHRDPVFDHDTKHCPDILTQSYFPVNLKKTPSVIPSWIWGGGREILALRRSLRSLFYMLPVALVTSHSPTLSRQARVNQKRCVNLQENQLFHPLSQKPGMMRD